LDANLSLTGVHCRGPKQMHISMRSLSVFITLLCLNSFILRSQDTTSISFGQGLINVVAKDSSWSTKTTFRFQTQYEGIYEQDSDSYSDRFRVRRARIKGAGWVTKSRKVRYKFEYDMTNGFVLDAVLKWKFAKDWEIWIGQTKLPGNVERVISSQNLQLVDCSIMNAQFNLDRDGGLQLRHDHMLGEMVVKESLALSMGEGPNSQSSSTGMSYTARLELFPFGKFKKSGDEYSGSDLRRNPKPRLMLGAVYDHNEAAIRSRSHLGSYFNNGSRNLSTLQFDAHFKHQGFSMMLEYSERWVERGSPTLNYLTDEEGTIIALGNTYYTGWGANAQMGYLLKSNWEVAARYSWIRPDSIIQQNDLDQYTLGLSRYIYGHNLKVQGDVSLLEESNASNQIMFRLQTEFTF